MSLYTLRLPTGDMPLLAEYEDIDAAVGDAFDRSTNGPVFVCFQNVDSGRQQFVVVTPVRTVDGVKMEIQLRQNMKIIWPD